MKISKRASVMLTNVGKLSEIFFVFPKKIKIKTTRFALMISGKFIFNCISSKFAKTFYDFHIFGHYFLFHIWINSQNFYKIVSSAFFFDFCFLDFETKKK